MRRAETSRREGVSDIIHPLLDQPSWNRRGDAPEIFRRPADLSMTEVGELAAASAEPRITPRASDFSVGGTSLFHLCAQKSLQGVNTDDRRGHESSHRHTKRVLPHLPPHSPDSATNRKCSRAPPPPLLNLPHSAELTVPFALHGQFSTVRRTSIRQCSQASSGTPAP